jgi:cold shock CspA family protein
MAVYTGKVVKFFQKKGYGFIERLDNGQQYFVHFKAITPKEDTKFRRRLYDFEYVQFTLFEDENTSDGSTDKKNLPQVKQVFGINGYTLRIDDEWQRKLQKDERRKKFNEDRPAASDNGAIAASDNGAIAEATTS